MKSKKYTIFDINGQKMQFDTYIFRHYFFRYCQPKDQPRKSVGDTEQLLGDSVHVSKDAVHQWRFGNNGPSTIETVKAIAEFLQIADYTNLMTEYKEENKTMYSVEQQKSFKRIYDAIIEFLEEFDNTYGFNDLWFEFEKQGCKDPEEAIEEYADKLLDKIWLIYNKEYFYLHDDEIYNKIGDYIRDVLYNTYHQKCSFAYRFEAPVETVDGKPSGVRLDEDYVIAISKINDLIRNVAG